MTLIDLLNSLLSLGPKLDTLSAKLDGILALLQDLKQQGVLMSAELDRLTADVTSTGDVVTSVEQAIAGLVQQVKDLASQGGTPAQFTALADQIDAFKARLAAAVVAGTPVAPTPAPTPAAQTRKP